MTTPDLETAYDALALADEVLGGLIDQCGRPDPFKWTTVQSWPSSFAALVRHIMGQQISTRLASTLYRRLAEAAGGAPTPEAVIALGPDALRRFGLSRAKAASVTDLSQRVLSGELDIEHLDALDDEAARRALIDVRGIGAWTAEMFLIMQLRRQDILPAGDLSIRRAIERAWQLSTLPSAMEVETRGLRWSPYRTYAAAVLWESLPSQRDEWARALAAKSDQ